MFINGYSAHFFTSLSIKELVFAVSEVVVDQYCFHELISIEQAKGRHWFGNQLASGACCVMALTCGCYTA